MFFLFIFLVIFSQSKVLAQDTELIVYAQPTELSSWLDHTGVFTKEGGMYIFPCTGNPPIDGQVRYSMSARGDLKKAITLASGNLNANRPNNVFNFTSDNSGIKYGVDGVCHQMTNRVMYSAGVVVDQSQLYGGSLSYTLYGVYGYGWDVFLSKCENQWNNNTTNTLKEKIISNSKGIMKEYLDIEFSADSKVAKILKRIDLLLKYKLKNIDVDKQSIYQAATDFVNSVDKNNNADHVEDEFKKFNERVRDVLGNEGYKQIFGINYDLSKMTLQLK